MTNKDEQVVHENENYTIVVRYDDYKDMAGNVYKNTYHVINKKTGVVETRQPILPQAIFDCEAWNHAMLEHPWDWRKEQAEALADVDPPEGPLN